MPSKPNSIISKLFPTCHRLLLEKHLKRELPKLKGSVLVVGAGYDPYRGLLKNSETIITTDIEDSAGNIDVVCDITKMPFDAGSFDTVVAVEVLEHIESLPEAFSEMHRVLKQDGTLLYSTPFMFHIHGDPDDYSRLTLSGHRKILKDKFAETQIIGYGNRFHVIYDLITTMTRLFVFFRLFSHFLAFFLPFSSKRSPSGYIVNCKKC